jgi:DNA-packaging protein gp3
MENTQKDLGGRPPKYATAEDMQRDIDVYFSSRNEIKRPTVTGLARALGMTRQSLINYGKDERFFDTVLDAKLQVEEFLENRLYDSAPTGAIFNLKNNYKWEDVVKNQNTSTISGGLSLEFETPADAFAAMQSEL